MEDATLIAETAQRFDLAKAKRWGKAGKRHSLCMSGRRHDIPAEAVQGRIGARDVGSDWRGCEGD